MPVSVLIPSPLQKLTNGQAVVKAEGATVADVVSSLEAQFPGMKDRLCDAEGKLRRFTNIYLNNEDIRFAENEKTAVKEGDELSIVPAVAGGR